MDAENEDQMDKILTGVAVPKSMENMHSTKPFEVIKNHDFPGTNSQTDGATA